MIEQVVLPYSIDGSHLLRLIGNLNLGVFSLWTLSARLLRSMPPMRSTLLRLRHHTGLPTLPAV